MDKNTGNLTKVWDSTKQRIQQIRNEVGGSDTRIIDDSVDHYANHLSLPKQKNTAFTKLNSINKKELKYEFCIRDLDYDTRQQFHRQKGLTKQGTWFTTMVRHFEKTKHLNKDWKEFHIPKPEKEVIINDK